MVKNHSPEKQYQAVFKYSFGNLKKNHVFYMSRHLSTLKNRLSYRICCIYENIKNDELTYP